MKWGPTAHLLLRQISGRTEHYEYTLDAYSWQGCGSEDAPIMTVLSLSCWWLVSIEGMVPDIARGRVVIVCGGGGRWAGRGEGCGGCEKEREPVAGVARGYKAA